MLDEVSVERRTFMWARIVSRPERNHAQHVHLAFEADALAGFVACGAQRTPALRRAGFDGEITALYVGARARRRGIGTALMRAAADDLARRGFAGLALWVLRDNATARRFYEALGGTVLGEAEDRRAHATLFEVAYGGPGLNALRPPPQSRT